MLVQNNITGNSVIFNKKLAKMVKFHNNIIMHDWWLGLIASAFGEIYFINEALLKYRKHSNNVIGAQEIVSLNNFNKFLNFSLEKNFLQAKAFKELYEYDLDCKNKVILDNFLELQSQFFLVKRFNIFKYKFLKQNLLKNIGLLWKI